MGDEVRHGGGGFEPPPWEREAFEALARKRAEEQVALDAIARVAALSGSAGLMTGTAAQEARTVRTVDIGPEPRVTGADAGGESKPPGEEPSGKTDAQILDERRVQAMLLELGKEEAASSGSIKLIARIAAVITATVGLGMLLGGMAAIQRAGGTTAGVMGSGALSVFGLCFVAMAAWVWVGSNRVKGSR